MPCPSDEDLARAACGELLDEVVAHVAACEACAAVIDGVRATESLVSEPTEREHDDAEPAPGASIGRFVVLRRLGRGGMGVVFLAYDPDHDRMLALKRMRGDGAPTATSTRLQRFKREFRVARDLHHPNLVRLGELFVEDGCWFFTMELIRGGDFLSYVRGAHGCDHDRLRATTIEIVRGLAALHRAGLVHRDIKPHNVLVEPDGRAIVLDFGVVAERSDALDRGRMVGTVSYMAPEQIHGEPVGPATDWYALGTMLFVALTGRPPFEGSTDDVLAAKLDRDGPAPSSIADSIPPALDRLCARLLARDAAARPGLDEILKALDADPEAIAAMPTPFVGRDDVLASLSAHFSASRSAAVVVTLEGEPGIGKTALADRAIAGWRTAYPEVVVLRGKCHARERIPYNAIDGAIDDLARVLSRLPRAEQDRIGGGDIEQLGRLFPTLPIACDASDALAPLAVRNRAFVALRDVVHRLAQQRPVVLVLDDMQWADADSLAALEVLLARAASPPILVVITARATVAQPWQPPVWLANVHRHALEGLRSDELAAMTGALRRSGTDLVRLRAETGGNPMLVEQWLSIPEAAGASTAMTLTAMLEARVSLLSRTAANLLEVLVVAGQAVPRIVAASATRLDPDRIEAALAELAAMRFARRDGTRGDALDVFHERIRDELHRGLGPRARPLHEALAEALIGADAAPDAIAAQLALAGQRVRASQYTRRAAEAAERALAFDRAALLYQQAIDSDERGAELLARLAGALANAGRPRESGDAYLAAAAQAHAPGEQLELRRRAAEQYLAGGYLERGLTEARALLAETGGGRLPEHDLQALGALLVGRARLAATPLRWRRRVEHELPPDVRTRLDLHWSLSIGLASLDNLRGAVFAIRLPLACVEQADELRIARALCAAAVSYAGMGLRRPTRRLIEAAERAAASDGSPLARFYAGLAGLASRFLIDNDWRAAQGAGTRLTALWRDAGRGRGWELDTVEQLTAFSELWLGELRTVQARVDALAEHAANAGNRFQEVGLRAYFGVLDTLLGDPAACERNVSLAIERSQGERANLNQTYWALRSRTYAAIYRGDVERASVELERAWDGLRTSLLMRVPTVGAEALAAIGGYAVARAAFARDREQRRRHLAVARRAARGLRRNPLFAGQLAHQTLAAGIAHVSGDDAEAVRLLRAADVTYRAAGMAGQLAATRLRLARLLGASEGEQLRADALAWFARERIADPERTTALLSPGWHPDA